MLPYVTCTLFLKYIYYKFYKEKAHVVWMQIKDNIRDQSDVIITYGVYITVGICLVLLYNKIKENKSIKYKYKRVKIYKKDRNNYG